MNNRITRGCSDDTKPDPRIHSDQIVFFVKIFEARYTIHISRRENRKGQGHGRPALPTASGERGAQHPTCVRPSRRPAAAGGGPEHHMRRSNDLVTNTSGTMPSSSSVEMRPLDHLSSYFFFTLFLCNFKHTQLPN